MSNNNDPGGGIAGARTSQFTIKYKAYGEPPPSSSKVKKRPSEHIKEALDPPLPHRDGIVRPRPCIIDKHNFAERHHFISTVPENEPLFQPFPPEVLFTGYEAFQKYTTVLQLRNNDKVVRRVQLLSRDPLLTVQSQSGEQTVYSEIGSSKVACGMEVAYTITFYPETDRDYTSELLAVTDREKFVIPVRCVGLKAMLDVPDEIVFPPTPAKCSYKKNVMIHNVGKKKAFFELKTKGQFVVKPETYHLDPGVFFQCCVHFLPRKICAYEGELEITFKDNGEQLFSKLIGIGTELDVGLSTGVIAAVTTYIRRTSHVTLQIFNNSSSVAYFLWPKFASEEELTDYTEQVGEYTLDQPTQDRNFVPESEEDALLSSSIDKAFAITPAKGEVWPGTLVELTVTFCPPKPLRYLSTTYCIISGKSDPLPLQLQGLGVGPFARFSPCELDLGELCLYSINTFQVSLENLGELDAHFRLMETLPSSMVIFTFEPDKGTVEPNEVQTVNINVCGDLMGVFSEKFLWEVTDSIHTLSLTFKGRIIKPSFSIDVKELDFGLVSYGLHSAKYMRVRNNSPVSLTFSFRILQAGDSSPEYTITPSCFLLGPDEEKKVAVELVPWEEKKYATVISVDIPKVGKDFATIPVQATCLVPIVKVSSDVLDFATCFLRYGYIQSLSLINESLVPARYEIQAQEQESENLAVLRLKADSGFVPADSCVPLEFSLCTQSLGEISITATISISGKEFTHFPVKVLAISVGPIIKIEKPLAKKAQPSHQTEEEGEWVPALDFGKVQVLKDHHLSLILRNACCIPAPLRISIAKKDSVYHLNLSEVPLEPFESVELKVRAYLDDASRFSDKVNIVFEGGELFIPLSALGVGSTLLCKELQAGFVHLGDQFTLRPFSYTFTVQNMGRKPQTLAWENETNRKQRAINKNLGNEAAKPGGKKAPVVIPEAVPVFTIAPDKATIKQYSSFSLTVSGYTTEAGHIQEDFTCKVTSAKDMHYIKLSVDADMAALTLIFSETTLKFVQNNGWGEDGPHELSKTLTCENVSRLPLSFSLSLKPPFHINQSDWTLPPSGSGVLVVSLEKQEIKEKQSTVLHGKLDIMYTGTLEKNNIDLIADINYPNLSLGSEHLKFGCVIINTCTRMQFELTNTSALDVWYSWTLDDNYGEGIRVSQDVLKKSGGIKIPANQIFDILPVRGYVRPGEHETVEVSYYAHPGYQCHLLALCEVSGGPHYTCILEAESGVIVHSLSRVALDFNVQAFNKTASKEFSLTNVGKVPFGYDLDLSCVKGKALAEVTPLSGSLDPGSKQKFTAYVYPGLPEKFADAFKVQVAYFVPTEISVFGFGAFPHILLDTTRIRSHKYLSFVPEAFFNAYVALEDASAPFSHRSMDSMRMSTVDFEKQKDPSRTEAKSQPEKNVQQREPELDTSAGENICGQLQDETTCIEVTSSESEHPKVPTIDQVDAEIDRLLLKEHLLHVDKETVDVQKFLLNAYVCDFGNVILGETKLKTVRITNDGPLQVMFKINMASVKSKGFTLDPDRLVTLPPFSLKSSMDLVFKVRTDHPKFPVGPISYSVPLFIKEGPQVSITFKAYVTKPVMELSDEHLDFGAVQLGRCKIMYVRLSNVGEVQCNWTAAKPDLGSADIHDSSSFTCEPDVGSMDPHEYVDVKVQFIPTHKKKSYFAVFHVDLMHNSTGLKFACRGQSYVPIFTIEPSVIQLGPILPSAPEPAQLKYTIRNNSDEPVEVYSLALDSQYVKEDEFLRDAEGYNERGLLFLERRDAGQPFWPHLLPQGTPGSREASPRQASPRAEKPKAPAGKGNPVSEVPKEPAISHANKLLIMMLGPPVVGKTTQAKKLSVRFNCPIVDMEDVIASATMKLGTSSTAEVSSGLQDPMTAREVNDFEKELIAALKTKLESNECTFGAIFDDLDTSYASTLSLAKCILYACGLEPYDPSNPIEDGKAKDKKKLAPPAKGKDKAKPEGEESTGPVVFPKTYWRGEPLVYAINLRAERAELGGRYSEIPEIDHCKKRLYVDMNRQKAGQNAVAVEPISPQQEPSTAEVPIYLKFYPYVSVFPTDEKLDKYYSSEVNMQNLLGGVKIETAEEASAETAPPLENKVVFVSISGLQESAAVFEEELQNLPNMNNVEAIPATTVLQVVKRPHKRTSFLDDTSELKFAILTVTAPSAEEVAEAKGKKGKGGDKPAGLKSEMYQITLKRNTEHLSPLDIIPEGHEKLTRWVIPPQACVEQVLRFWSPSVGNFEQKFVFESLNGNNQARLICKGVCAEPQIACHYRHVRIPNTKLSAAAKLQKAFFISEGTLDFGPLPTGRSADGFPNLPDSEHCKRLEIVNTGLFDLHVDFEIGQGGDAPAPAGKKPAKAQGGKALFMVNPPAMDLKIDEQQHLNIYCYPPQGQLGPLEGKLIGRVEDNPTPVVFKVICLADTPRVELDLTAITFERLLLNQEVKKCITIRNISALLVHWKILGLENGPEEFTFSETSGSLNALGNASVEIIFKAIQEKIFNQKLKLQVFETTDAVKVSQELPLSITAEAYKIDIAIKYPSPPEEIPPDGGFNYGTVKVAQDSMKSLILDNKGKYKVAFKFCCKTALLRELFTITPSEGSLDPKKQQKVDIHFNKEKKLQKEVTLKQSRDMELHFIESLTGKTEQIVAVMMNVHAVHSKFQLLPAQSIHFGSQICDSTPAPRVLKLVNTGEFDFTFRLVALSEVVVLAAAKTPDKGKKPDKKGGATGEALELNNFRVIPSSGSVLPGSQIEISVHFKTETPFSASENFKIDIADTDPFKYPVGLIYELSGASCIPGINADPRTIFYEYQLVDEIDLFGSIPAFGIYSKKDKLFSFGPVIINHEKAAMAATAGKDKPIVQIGKESKDICVNARLKIENPLRVPCSLQFSVCRPGEAAGGKPGGKDKPAAKGALEEPLCMEVYPLSADIPPLEYIFVTCSFKPLALQRYCGVFEVLLKDEAVPQFKCELRGEGTLPHLHIESPSTLSPLGFPWLQFPRLLVGKSLSLPIVLENNGLVPAVARLETSGDDNVDWFQMNHNMGESLAPLFLGKKLSLSIGSSETAMVTFTPRAGQQYKQDIKVIVDQNPFDILTISITGEGYTEEVLCLGLPRNLDDAFWFEDCGIGTSNPISFTLKNTAADKHWRFGWSDVPFVKFSPALGHLHAGSSKEILVTFNPTEAVEYLDKEIHLQLCNILYTGEGGPVDWDDRMLPPADSAPVEEAKGKAKAPPPPKVKGKPDPKAAPELTIESDIKPGELPLEIVKGTAKAIALKLHAVADNARYECSMQSVQFKSTMMFQVRTYPFTLKNLSRAYMAFSWQVEMQDGTVDKSSMYLIEPSSGVISAGETVDFVLKFCPIEVQDCTRFLSPQLPNLDATMKPLRIPVTGQVTRPWCHFELPRSDYALRRDPHFAGPNGELGPLDPAVHIIEFDSLGSNIRNVKYFTAVNPTNIPYKFVWEEKKSQSLRWTPYDLEPITDDDVFPRPFKCMTRVGEIHGGKRYEIGFEYTPNKLELHESFWIFRIPGRKIDVNFLLVGNVKKPELSLDRSYVDFGQVLLGARVRTIIYLKNLEVSPFAFNFDKLSYSPSQPGQMAILKFTPSRGIVAESSTVPVELLFSPVVEGEHSFDAVCNLKMASPLSLSVKAEAYVFHEKVYLGGDDGRPLALIPKEPLRMDYGQVMINSKLYKKFILTNSGKAAFHFMWDCGENSKLVRVEPVAGVVAKDEQLTCDLLFNPTAPDTFQDFPVVCQILHGNKYLIHLNGKCYRPKIRFSFTEYDFGACFLHQPGLTPRSIELILTNEGPEVLTCELLYENTSFLEVQHVSMNLSPNQSHTIKVCFKPDAFVGYKEAVKFQINGLDTVTVIFKGEGVPVLLELVDPTQRYLAFGVVRLGKSVKQQIQIINKSKISAPISFKPSAEIMQKHGVSCFPKEGLHLLSRYTGTIELLYNPKTRMTPFTEGLVVEVAGIKSRILTVSGTCLAVEVKLNTTIMPFDLVTLGSKVTKKIQLENRGDLATNFLWDLSKCKMDFTIFPLEGFLAPRQVAKLDVTFHPSRANPDIRIEGIPCQLDGGDPLHLTLLGGCVEQSASETLKFSAAVRTTETKTIQLQNATTVDWLLHPVISHEFWTGAVTIAVPANQTVGYGLTYRPMTMCVPNTELHRGTISFPLPDGTMRSYQLFGEAGPPLPDGNIRQDAKARRTVPISLLVQNWLKATQPFVVIIQMNQADASTVLKGPKNIDVPGMSKKECVLYLHAQKPGTTTATVTFKNEKSGEYSLFTLTVDTVEADIVETVSLECFVRQRVSHTLYLKNPLDEVLTFKTNCQDQAVLVPAAVEIQGKSTVPVELAFRPLVEGTTTCMLIFQNGIIGDYEYELKLRSVAAPPEAPLLFSVSLGNQLSQTFNFKHFLPIKSTYTCVLSQAAIDGGFTVEPAVVQANPAGSEGLDLQVQVMFEPSRVFEDLEALLTLKSSEGSDYCCKLLGSCSSPFPQGPFFIKGSGQINFKNVYNETVQFNYMTDNPAFVVSKGEKMPPKKQSKLVVSYKAAGDAPKTGRLTVTCEETDDVWVFYLQAV